uniref:Transposase n=1 Tax=Mesocestoides corti TaxID=53468 RepID=A0A5K3FTN2_MESCO
MCLLGSPRRWRVAVLVLTGVVFILSTFLLGVGLYYLLENCDTYCSFVELALPVALVLFAIISMLSAAVGYIGALFTNLLTIRLFAIFEIVIFVCQVCAALTFLQINEKLLPASVREIRALIAQAENSTVINRADVILENMQRRYQCCGGDNQSDWKNGPPLSCCVNPNYLDNTCKYPGIFVRGCADAMYRHFLFNAHTWMYAVVVILVVKLFVLVAGSCLQFQVNRSTSQGLNRLGSSVFF